MTTAVMLRVPDIGEVFEDGGHRFRVTGWLKRNARNSFWAQEIGPDRCKLIFCSRDDAEYISGYGVSGIIRRIGDVEIFDRINWPEAWIAELRQAQALLVGRSAG